MHLSFVFLVLHLLGLAVGAGGAFTTDLHVFVMLRKGVLSQDAYTFIHRAGSFVFMGLGLSLLSGLGLFSQAPAFYLHSTPFLTKMLLVLIVAINGLALRFIALPVLKDFIGKEPLKEASFHRHVPMLSLLTTISATTWVSIIILGVNLGLSLPFWEMVLIYLGTITVVFFGLYAAFVLMVKR